MTNERKKINLALQGGGAHGAFTWGVLDGILEDERLEIDCISACSAGSVNAATLAYGMMKGGNQGAREALETLWLKVSQIDSYFAQPPRPLMDLFMRNACYSMLDGISRIVSPYQSNLANTNPIKDILIEQINFEELRQYGGIKLFLTSTNVRSGLVRVFNTNEMTADMVIASASLPNLFQATKIGEEYYWDGGYSGNPALFPLFYHSDTSDVIIVHINPMVREEIPTTANEIANRINEITFNSSLLYEFRAVAFVNKMLDNNWIKDEFRPNLRHMLIHSIKADDVLKGFNVASKFDTHWYFLTYLRDLGREEAKKWIAKHFNDIGKKCTVDIYKDYLDM